MQDLNLVLRYDGLKMCKWNVDAAFAVHPDFKSHSGGGMFISPLNGGMASGSTKQKLNTRSSTEAEIMCADNFLTKVIWCKFFLGERGVRLNQNMLFQDNMSAELLEKKGRTSCGKR